MGELIAAIRDDRRARVGGAIVLGFVVIALFGHWLAPDPLAFVAAPHSPPSWKHWFGTNGQGQDVLAQAIAGARVTLAVGFAVGAVVTSVGTLVGIAAGYLGGRADDALSLLTNVFLVIPGLPLAIILAAWLPPGPLGMVAVLSVAGWAWNARVFRAQAMSIRGQDFVAAAIVSGESHLRIITVEILPNMISLLVSAFIGATVYAIGAQVGLEFLGLGDVGAVTWGTNLYWAANDAALLTGSWWIFVPTGLGVALVGFGLTLINFAIDEVNNRTLRSERIARQAALDARLGELPPVTATPAPDALLSLRDVRVSYPGAAGITHAVDGVDLDIAPGEVVGLAGESGSGKSTIGFALLRLLPVTARVEGGIWFGGAPVHEMAQRELASYRWHRVSMVFQSAMNALNPVATVRTQITDTLVAHDVAHGDELEARAGELLDLVGIDRAHLDAYPHQLSGGMRQRVVIAIALALRPQLLIMDEPTTALDVVVQREILQRIDALRREFGFAVLFITHDMPLLVSFADRILVMKDGVVVARGTPAELEADDVHPYAKRLLNAFPPLPPPGPRAELEYAHEGAA